LATFTSAALVLGLASSPASAAKPNRGGSLEVLAPAGAWPGLDPATDASDVNDDAQLSSIYGQLFELAPHGVILADEATGYKYSNHNLTVDITLRQGVKFQDGSPFNATAVAFSINRDLAPANSCICLANFTAVQSVTAIGARDVRIQLSTPYSALIPSFIDSALNWTVSPTSFNAKGESQFSQDPVGAGPFKVVSNIASSKLVLTRNPSYWEKGHPYLAGITFLSTTSDQSDVSAIQSGQAQIAPVTTVSLVQEARSISGLAVHAEPATYLEFIRLNTQQPPFNNPLAREAVTYATDTRSIIKNLYGGLYTGVQGMTAPGMLFYEKSVPGYDSYNLKKAKQLVNQLGGLTVELRTNSNTFQYQSEAAAVAAMWQAAGIKVNVVVDSLQLTLSLQASGGWQALDAAWSCSTDPATCLPINYSSGGSLSGIKDSSLDGLLNQGAQFASTTTRGKIYDEINAHVAKSAEMNFLYARPVYLVTSSNVEGLQDVPASAAGEEQYENVWLK
jgi:peptide/nickel transport system substrate-binding protein